MENQFWVIEPLDSVWVSERWNLAGEHFPDAVQIVDRFHAEQHFSDVSKSIYGAGTDLEGGVIGTPIFEGYAGSVRFSA